MAAASLDLLLRDRRLWRGHATPDVPPSGEPSGDAGLDALLPTRGWPEAALTELLVAQDGIGELSLLLPTLARLTQTGRAVAWVSPPYVPCAAALARAGLDLRQLQVVQAGRESAWAIEQCLRSQACGAVLGWLWQADDKTLRRLQVAAETGKALAFVFRPERAALNASPAALRLRLRAGELRVLKCRGGVAPAQVLPLAGARP